MTNRPAALNRVLLTIIGLVLLAVGVFTLTTAYGVLHWLSPQQTLVPTGVQLTSWAPYLAVIVAVLVGIACLFWLAAQVVRRPKTGTWRLSDDPDTGLTTLEASAAVDPLVDDITDYPGVRSATAWLTGHPAAPHLVVRVRTDYDAHLDALRARIHTHAVPRLRQALELRTLPTTLQFEPTTATTRTR